MKQKKDVMIVGFALFSVFFGAGNLIFPPFIGVTSGSDWLTSFLGFILGDIGIILLSIYAIAKCGNYQAIIGRAGKTFGLSLEFIMMLCLGPIVAIPRTAATTFELSITPLIPSMNSVIFSIIFFTLTLLLTIRPTKVMDIIGEFLTPILLVCLIFLIGKGILFPLGTLNREINSDELFVTGLKQGYQTLDALGIGAITAFMMASFNDKGYTTQQERINLTIKATLLACFVLTLVYGGLTYLGATVSNQFDASVSQTTLLISITQQLMGQSGTIILGIIVAFACLTTAIGLTSVTSKYFEDVTNKKLKYEHIAIFICAFSAIASTIGVDQIIALSVPILTIIYPVSIILIILSLLKRFFSNNLAFVFAGYTTLLISVLTIANIPFMNELPLANLGLNWLLPSLIVAILGEIIGVKKRLTFKSPIKDL
ncbi:MAG: branched-chain amino acid transport system II carrier protein [Turicibacter sp.]|nr:branched-chain amino acid transport system II carrier protein [Turicibacter sp.]